MTPPPAELWRVFPWDPDARPGERFSAEYVPPVQGKGRFDLPGSAAGVLYLSERPEHAVAEGIQHFRGQTLDPEDLLVAGLPLSLVSIRLPDAARSRVLDLCDAAVLVDLGVRPDQTASRDRRATQRIAALVHAGGHLGLRWWSALGGDWHMVALFRDRLETSLTYSEPEELSLEHGAVREAARVIGVGVQRRQ